MTKYRRTSLRQSPPRNGRQRSRRLGTTALVVATFLIVATLGLLYVRQVNTVATSGLVISDLEQKIGQLQTENEDLDLRAASLRSLTTVEESSKDLNLLVRAKIQYLPALPDTVARGE